MKNKYFVVFENWDISIDAWGDTSYGEKGFEAFNTYKQAEKYAQDIAIEGGISAIYYDNEGYAYYCDEKYMDELDNLAIDYTIIKED